MIRRRVAIAARAWNFWCRIPAMARAANGA
jgi:hypothetical protein